MTNQEHTERELLDAMRREFEASGITGRLSRSTEPGYTDEYADSHTQIAWRAWQTAFVAGRAAAGKDREDSLVVEVFYQKGDPPFICGVYGKAPIHSLSEIEEQLCQSIEEESGLLGEDGEYTFRALWEKPQMGEFGRLEFEGYWDLTCTDFKSISAIDAAKGRSGT